MGSAVRLTAYLESSKGKGALQRYPAAARKLFSPQLGTKQRQLHSATKAAFHGDLDQQLSRRQPILSRVKLQLRRRLEKIIRRTLRTQADDHRKQKLMKKIPSGRSLPTKTTSHKATAASRFKDEVALRDSRGCFALQPAFQNLAGPPRRRGGALKGVGSVMWQQPTIAGKQHT